jgi:hypothetical protein
MTSASALRLPRYFDVRLDTRKDRCFVAECFRRLKAKQ